MIVIFLSMIKVYRQIMVILGLYDETRYKFDWVWNICDIIRVTHDYTRYIFRSLKRELTSLRSNYLKSKISMNSQN